MSYIIAYLYSSYLFSILNIIITQNCKDITIVVPYMVSITMMEKT